MTDAFQVLRKAFFKKLGKVAVREGDLPGHEFRGNQWTTGISGSVKSFSKLDEDGNTISYNRQAAQKEFGALERAQEKALTEEERIQVNWSQGAIGGMQTLNPMVREVGGNLSKLPGKGESGFNQLDYRGMAQALDRAVEISPGLSENAELWRGCDKMFARAISEPGSTFSSKGFTSLAFSSRAAESFAHLTPGGYDKAKGMGLRTNFSIVRVLVGKGTKVATGDKNLKELILGRNTKFYSRGIVKGVVTVEVVGKKK
jgi:hypothetical protein